MMLDTIHGTIQRRVLLNYRLDREVLARVPGWLGLGSENAAHRRGQRRWIARCSCATSRMSGTVGQISSSRATVCPSQPTVGTPGERARFPVGQGDDW